MPKRTDIKTILIIGSGPIIIGQACEFDYSGTQACQALKEEGYRVVLVNSNPATIMTDPEIADATYIEPLIPETIIEIIKKEKVDAILSTMGGQTALNLSYQLSQEHSLDKLGVELIGATRKVIDRAENRLLFQKCMQELDIKTPVNIIVESLEDIDKVLQELMFPIIIRPSYTLGGVGGGIAYNREELYEAVKRGLDLSPVHQILLEQSITGWKEFEFEVMRDSKDNAIIVCSIENISPMGIHTGDSITVAPALTLTDKELQYMRNASLSIIRKIGVNTGGANVQFAMNPENGDIVVIEMNPRVSRSSALASKATGFPIAKIAAKLSVGYTLDEIKNEITQTTCAAFEPALDYIVTKMPRFDFEKFPNAKGILSTYMQSVGEVMAIGKTFPESLQKCINSLEKDDSGFTDLLCRSNNKLLKDLEVPTEKTLFLVGEALRNEISIDTIYKKTKIDKWFLYEIKKIIDFEKNIKENTMKFLNSPYLLRESKKLGFSDKRLSLLCKCSEEEIRTQRYLFDINPIYRRIDTCAGEFESYTPYLYSTYERQSSSAESECESLPSENKKVVIIGSGPNRIGQGIEFDYCCVKTAQYIKKMGFETIMINCNPETVSTDPQVSSRLYFEPLCLEYVLEIIKKEGEKGNLLGCILQVGGQVPFKILHMLEKHKIPILGTSVESIDKCENRGLFKNFLENLNINQPKNFTVNTIQELESLIEKKEFPFPLIMRPSYVIGGASMLIYQSEEELKNFMVSERKDIGWPILVEEFLEEAIELEVDAVSDGKNVFIPTIMEQFEKAGIHSGDSSCSVTSFSISKEIENQIQKLVKKMCRNLHIKGFLNAQFALKKKTIYVIEINPRASRTLPFVSKALGINLIEMGISCLMGGPLKLRLCSKRISSSNMFYVKRPIFSFSKVRESTRFLGPEMRSTGEVMGTGKTLEEAIYKSILADYNESQN